MPFLAVLAVLLLFLAALGQSLWWRGPGPVVGPWYGNAAHPAFCWGVWCLALYITWPTIHTLL
jgi:hypothetical protein